MEIGIELKNGITIRVSRHLRADQWVLESGPIPALIVSEAIWEEIRALPTGFSDRDLEQAFRRVCGADTSAVMVIPSLQHDLPWMRTGLYPFQSMDMAALERDYNDIERTLFKP